MKRNNLKRLGIGLLSTILFASFTGDVKAGTCADYSQSFTVTETGGASGITSQNTYQSNSNGKYQYWNYSVKYNGGSGSISGVGFCIDPAKSGWSGTGYCTREVNPYDSSNGVNVQRFDRALTYLYDKYAYNITSNRELGDLTVKLITYYYGLGESNNSSNNTINWGPYKLRHETFLKYRNNVGYSATDKNAPLYDTANSNYTKALSYAKESVEYANNDANWTTISSENIAYIKDKGITEKNAANASQKSSEDLYWAFTDASGKEINATKAGNVYDLGGYTGEFTATAYLRIPFVEKLASNYETALTAAKNMFNFKCDNSTCQLSNITSVGNKKYILVGISVKGNTSTYNGGIGSFNDTNNSASIQSKGNIVILNSKNVDTGNQGTGMQRYVFFLNNEIKKNADGNKIADIILPKLQSGCRKDESTGLCYGPDGKTISCSEYEKYCPSTCYIKDGKYYVSNGKEVTESEYLKQCPMTCKVETDVTTGRKIYRGQDGKIVDEATYNTQCKNDNGPQCEVKNGKYYIDGKSVSKKKYEDECPCSSYIRAVDACYEPGDADSKNYDTIAAKIYGPRNVKQCFFPDGVELSDDSNKKDEAKNTYKLSNTDEAVGVLENKYCAVYCKEDYVFEYPNVKYGNQGEYFKLKLNITGEKTCYEKVDVDKFNSDVATQQQKVVDAYNKYSAFKKISDAYRSSSKNSCGGASFTTYFDTYNVSGNRTSNTATVKVGKDESELFGCVSVADYPDSYQFADSNSLDSKLKATKEEFDTAKKELDKMLEDIEDCIPESAKSGGWDDGINDKYTTWYDPEVSYTYDTEYKNQKDITIAKDKNFSENIDDDQEVWSCNGESNNSLTSCNGTKSDKFTFDRNRTFINCTDNGCSTTRKDVPTTKYYKVISSVDADYTSKTLYKSRYPDGKTTNTDIKNDYEIKDNYKNLVNGVPIHIEETDGLHKYSINIDNLGRYYDKDKGDLGRLIGGSKSVYDKFDLDSEYVCSYDVNDCEEYIKDPNTGEYCCITEAIKGADGKYYCSNPQKDTCKLVVDDRDNICCEDEEVLQPDGTKQCSECTEYTDKNNNTCCKEDAKEDDKGDLVCCPECKVVCFCPYTEKDGKKCEKIDDYTCKFSKDEDKCKDGECKVECIGSNCIKLEEGNVNVRQISETNINANETSKVSNWTEKNEKVEQTINQIQSSASENKTPEYKFVLSPKALSSIRESNKSSWNALYQSKENNYLTCDYIGTNTQRIACKSNYLDWLVKEVYNGSCPTDGSGDCKYDFNNTDNFTTWTGALTKGVGPAWK